MNWQFLRSGSSPENFFLPFQRGIAVLRLFSHSATFSRCPPPMTRALPLHSSVRVRGIAYQEQFLHFRPPSHALCTFLPFQHQQQRPGLQTEGILLSCSSPHFSK